MTSRQESMKEGKNVERYIATMVCDDHCIDVTNDNSYPGVDFLIPSGKLDVKNAWNTENGGNKTLRESRGIKKWYRKNKDGTNNWHLFPYKPQLLSENGFLKFCGEPEIHSPLEALWS